MATTNRGRFGGPPQFLLLGLIVIALAACGGASAPAAPETPADAAAPTDFVDTDGDGSDEPSDGQVDPGDGFESALYVDGDDLGRILSEDPDPDCQRSTLFASESCTWTSGDGETVLKVEFSRDPNLSTLEDYVDHMETLMSRGTTVDGLGQAAFVGPNPLGSGVRVTAFVGDGLHIWVSIARDGDEATVRDLALNLATKIVAMA